MDLSIIIVNYNTAQLIDNAIQSVKENVRGLDYEIIVVDNNSSDNSVELIARKYPEITLIPNNFNAGFTKANNQGYEVSKGKAILLLNPDTKVIGEAINLMYTRLSAEDNIGIVGPKLFYPSGNLQYSCRPFPDLGIQLLQSLFLPNILPKSPVFGRYKMSWWDHNADRDVDWVSGACLMIKRELVENYGLLDEGFFMYCEEVDLCYRVKEHGFRVVYIHGAEVIHYEGESSKQFKKNSLIQSKKSMALFYNKHYSRSQLRIFVCLSLWEMFIRFFYSGIIKGNNLPEQWDAFKQIYKAYVGVLRAGKQHEKTA